MKIENRIYKSELVDWQEVNDLQPQNLKDEYNISYLRDSILKYGVSKAYDICEIEGKLYWLDGHTRTNMFQTLQSEGIEIPSLLMANFCRVKNRQEAITILLEVHNQKLNKINEEVLIEYLEVNQIEISEVNVVSLNVMSENLKDIDFENIEGNEERKTNDKSKEVTCDKCGHNFFV
jgi:hypothetical protein